MEGIHLKNYNQHQREAKDMPAFQNAQVIYFSGTGGTRRAAEALAQALNARGCAATLAELDHRPLPTAQAELLVLLYPVYAAHAPQPIMEWLAALPDHGGQTAAVISVSGGGEVFPNNACRVDVIRQLQKKGIRVPYEAMIVMPPNFLYAYSDEACALLLREAPRRAERIAEALLAGEHRRTRLHPLDLLISLICRAEWVGSRYFGKRLHANDQCIHCGWCANHCPRGNITLKDGRPAFDNRCVLCLRCVYGCPEHAITPGILKSVVLKGGFDLAGVEKRMAGKTDFPPVKEIAPGLMLGGVRKYLLEGSSSAQASYKSE